MNLNLPALTLARFEICRVRRGYTVERFRPFVDRSARAHMREMLDAMREDARRFGDSLVVRRAGRAA